nr:MAG TPA: hypothetical protein [Caudoviricetes sp.]
MQKGKKKRPAAANNRANLLAARKATMKAPSLYHRFGGLARG